MPVFKDISSGRGLEKSVVVDVADDQLGGFAVVRVQHRLVQLSHQMLLERFLGGDRIEKKLALVFRFLGTAAVAARLRHVIAPFLIQFGQLIELSLEIFVGRGGLFLLPFLRRRIGGQLFQDRIGFHFLLDQIAQFEQGRLEDQEALLKLRGKDLLKG